ncbi:MAG: hypothetical protein PHE25_03385 [Candidatus Gracilibacteria bacterium]|nr:hypothetical protein [Candidatus Gracilibacteria bacterium]
MSEINLFEKIFSFDQILIGDNTKTGIKTMTYPGRIIENDSFTMPGEIVK